MAERNAYFTIYRGGTGEVVEKKSRFIGETARVTDEEQAAAFVEGIRKHYYDARHHCFAYVIGADGKLMRAADDGEPQGTAGKPMLEVLTGRGLANTIVVVTRYFGGTLLGTGGLVRAYSASAKKAVEAANIINMIRCSVCTLVCDYNRYGKVSSLIPQSGGIIDESSFGSDVSITFHIRSDYLERFNRLLADATCGELCSNAEYEDYFAMEEQQV